MPITLEGLALFISLLISAFGLITAIVGVLGLIQCKSATPIEGEIVDEKAKRFKIYICSRRTG